MSKLGFGWTFTCALGLLACDQRGERVAANGSTATRGTTMTAGASTGSARTAGSAGIGGAATSATAPAASPAPSPAPSAPPAPSASAVARTCEVEIFGTVDVPKDAPKPTKVVVYVAQDDCLAVDAHVLGHIPASPSGSFVIEVFPKWGTDVTICAAAEDASGKATHYGKASSKAPGGRFHAEAEGEVTFNDVKIAPKKGPAHTFPHDTK